jgi:Family of unknown function (DUF7009)
MLRTRGKSPVVQNPRGDDAMSVYHLCAIFDIFPGFSAQRMRKRGGSPRRDRSMNLIDSTPVMKLRIKGNSLRLRVSRSELTRFLDAGSLEDTVYFGPDAGAELSYALVLDHFREAVNVESSSHRVAVLLPEQAARKWASTDQVGISANVDLGVRGTLSVLIEKDFACLDRSDEDNSDTFPNPLAERCL